MKKIALSLVLIAGLLVSALAFACPNCPCGSDCKCGTHCDCVKK